VRVGRPFDWRIQTRLESVCFDVFFVFFSSTYFEHGVELFTIDFGEILNENTFKTGKVFFMDFGQKDHRVVSDLWVGIISKFYDFLNEILIKVRFLRSGLYTGVQ